MKITIILLFILITVNFIYAECKKNNNVKNDISYIILKWKDKDFNIPINSGEIFHFEFEGGISFDIEIPESGSQWEEVIPCLNGIQVKIIKDMPNGFGYGDKPRFEVIITGTNKKAWPWKESLEYSNECLSLEIGNN